MEEKFNNQEPVVSGDSEQETSPETAREPEAPIEAPIENNGGTSSPKKGKPVIAVVIVVAALIAGGIVYYMAGVETEEPLGQQEAENIIAEIEGKVDAASEKLQEQGTSDEVADIEADLGATELDALDQEMQNIDAELNF